MISLSWFSCGSSILVELEFEDVGLCGGRKIKPAKNQEKNSRTGKPTTNYKLNPHKHFHPCVTLAPSLAKAYFYLCGELPLKITKLSMSLKYRQWLLEALPYVYKEEVFELIAEKVYTRDLEPKLAVPVLRGLALTTNPTEKMCQDISV